MDRDRRGVFEKLCEQVSNDLDIEVVLFHGEPNQMPFHDDGNLHVVKRGVRACFDVGFGQSLSESKMNHNTRRVLVALGMQKILETPRHAKRVLLTEYDEGEDQFCGHCGREYE